ncbi:hypothetical protein LEP3755_42280 [Leptolyngbya sp. NIES-3755]|nr:hypothetical protein LEP3755_42280 [Leptolyngbya sp. NIES-3755]
MTPTINSERYGELLSQYQPRVVKTEEENERFLAIVEELMARPELTPEEDAMFDLLVQLIETFEQEHYEIGRSTPQSIIHHLLDARGLSPSDLVPVLGSEEIVEAIVQEQAKISPEQAATLGKFFHVSASLFQ